MEEKCMISIRFNSYMMNLQIQNLKQEENIG